MVVCRGALVLMVALTTCFVGASCSDDGWQPPRIVRLEGALQTYSISPMYGAMFGAIVDQDDDEETGLYRREWSSFVLVRPGELVALTEGPPFPYLAGDPANVAVNASQEKVLLEGRTVAIELGREEGEGWAWLAQAPAETLADIRLVSLKDLSGDDPAAGADGLPADRRDALDRLRAASPNAGVLVTDKASLALGLGLFDPPWLSLGDIDLTEDEQAKLAAEPRLQTLFLKGAQTGGLGFLKRLPMLRTLVMTDWAGLAEDQPPETLPTLKNLRTLIVFGGKMRDLAPVGGQPILEELVIVGGERLTDLAGLTRLSGLKALCLPECQEVADLAPLASLKHLRWLSLPPATTQEQFATLCADHRDLVVLQAIRCEKITDLAPAKGLRKLQVLCATTTAPLGPLAEIKSLRLLGLHTPKAQEEAAHAQMQQALVAVMKARPGLKVVEAAPLCLGSGWILLLAPSVAAGCLLARRRQAGHGVPRHA